MCVCRFITKPLAQKYGETLEEKLMLWLQGLELVELCLELGNSSRRKTQRLRFALVITNTQY